MRGCFERTRRFLDTGLDLRTRVLLVAAAALLSAAALYPLWNLTMFAPQYPDGLRLDIYAFKLVGGNGGQDLKEINLLNHYIGMRDLAAEDFTEFAWMPFILGALALLALRAAVHGRMEHLVDVLVLNGYFAAFSLWSFAHKLYLYGHQLAPNAPVTVEPFMPPLFGYQQIANFEVYSYPGGASYALGASMLLLVIALAAGWWRARADAKRVDAGRAAVKVAGCVTLILLAPLATAPAAAQPQPQSREQAQALAPVTAVEEHGESRYAASTVEGRPSRAQASPLQARIDAAAAGAVLRVEAGTWRGDLLIDKPLTLIGVGRPRLIGSGAGSVLRIRAADVTVEGFDIDGLAGGDLGRDTSGIHVYAHRATIRDVRVKNALFGIYLREADGATIERVEIEGPRGKGPGEKGSGIHVWNTQGFRLTHNRIAFVRDGFYIQASSGGRVDHNRASDLRYGLHYMFSDDNTFEDNLFERGDAGTALMYSRRLVFRRNRFVRNRGFASVGLLFKSCDDVTAEENLIADNARGIFLEGSARATFRRNIVAGSDTAVVLYDSTSESRFEENLFAGNMTPLLLVGRRTDTNFDGNYWSGNRELDLDGDGRTDRAYRLSNAFDHFRGNLTAADLYVDGVAATAMAAAESAFPVLEPIAALDHRPLARPPALAATPRPEPDASRRTGGLAAAGLVLGLGLAGLRQRRRERRSGDMQSDRESGHSGEGRRECVRGDGSRATSAGVSS